MTPAALKSARLALGLSQDGLAQALGMAANGRRTVRRWETGASAISTRTALAVDALLAARS